MKFIIGFLVTLGLLIFVFVLILRGPSDNGTSPETATQLVDYADGTVAMQLTTMGPVSADLTHRETRITVTSSETTFEAFQGYQGTLIRSQSYINNSAAYADFLRALDLAGYTVGTPDEEFQDVRGYCPEGYRYIFEIKDGERNIQRFWATSCGGAATFKGKTPIVLSLYQRQVPDFNTLTNGIF